MTFLGRTAFVAVPLLLAASACASLPTPAASPCGADKASAYVGRQATPEVRGQVQAAVGPRTIRWIGPDDVVTLDFSDTRLNMMLDAAGRITATRCG